ncbi:hypothetical protein GUJ93_ZPchr0005g14260 [Zizania palustris]|uniref:Coatomer subunit zeta n=1 Tax=Zizania palustris TaxID=103762 RepID=A0A8J5VR95_ZIZPA|nr:hypothetical protein GUJ93_ZPchr0005g14260 [Zizania palustris]
MESCPSVKNILLLDSEGKRVAVKYYTDGWPTLSAKLAFEKSVFVKTQKATAGTEVDVVMFDGEEENELILASVLQGFTTAIDSILRNNIDKRTALENLDLILLCLDEIVDGGIVLETEGSVIAEKVSAHGAEGATSLAEQTLVQALTTAREHLTKSLLMTIGPRDQILKSIQAACRFLACKGIELLLRHFSACKAFQGENAASEQKGRGQVEINMMGSGEGLAVGEAAQREGRRLNGRGGGEGSTAGAATRQEGSREGQQRGLWSLERCQSHALGAAKQISVGGAAEWS